MPSPLKPRASQPVASKRDRSERAKSSPPGRRAQGRPTEASSAVGPEVLIAAAQELLQTLPPAKVTRAAVARHAGVDPNLIRYYFSDRASLLLAVLERIVTREAQQAAPAQGGTAAERLAEHVRSFFRFNGLHPYLHRLLIEEFAASEFVDAREAFHKLNQSAISTYAVLLKDGVKDGSLRKADPVLVHISVVGLCAVFFESRLVIEDALGKAAPPAALIKRYAEMISTMVVAGLHPH